jgi:hypothetical protein
MNKIMKTGIMCLSMMALLTGCGQQPQKEQKVSNEAISKSMSVLESATAIVLSDEGVTVSGQEIATDTTADVYMANDIVYYKAGKDFTYGEGTKADEHSKKEAEAHRVVHITKPGTYALSGTLSVGQIAVDLGKEAEKDPEAVVTLVMNNVDITCTVAPAVIFYNVYECATMDAESASKNVDTTRAGANVIIADGTENRIEGAYVARIYESYVLNEDGTEVVDNEKLHKYDGAFYSKQSMNIYGCEEGNGVLNIKAENEGLDTEMHLTIHGGKINITSGNDGINTNEDGMSVTTINGGDLQILVDGATGEGDGIDSNGWLVINGGTVIAEACSKSADAGIDSDMGIHINGGMVVATGHMIDRIAESNQNFAVFSFESEQKGGNTYSIKDDKGGVVAECTPKNAFSSLVVSDDNLTEGTYTIWKGEDQLSGTVGMGGMMGRPNGGERPEGMEPSKGGERPEGMEPPKGGERPEGMEPPKGGERPERMEPQNVESVKEFEMAAGGNYIGNVK